MDYESLGYDKFLSKKTPSLVDITEDITSIKTPQISQTTVIGEIPKEKIQQAVGELIKVSSVTNVSVALNNGQQVTIITEIIDKDDKTRIMFGIPEITIYEDNLGNSNSRIPDKHGLDEYGLYFNFDYHRNVTGDYPSTAMTACQHFWNNSGGNHTYYWYIRWRYIGKVAAEG